MCAKPAAQQIAVPVNRAHAEEGSNVAAECGRNA
jgi:hypothetical protein